MRMSHTNYKNVIEGLGGDPMRFLLLLVHTLNVFINKFASGARNFFFIFQCHTVTNGTDLRRSPQGVPKGSIWPKTEPTWPKLKCGPYDALEGSKWL